MLNKTVYVRAREAHTPGRREDHVGVFGGRGNGGDPALVAGHRAEVAEGFHGVGRVVLTSSASVSSSLCFAVLAFAADTRPDPVTATVTGTV